MIRAFIAGTCVAIVAPCIGTFLVVRRYSYMADTLAHVSLVGVACALLSGVNPVTGATVAAVAAGIGMERLRQTSKIFSDSVLSMFLSGSLALTVVLISAGRLSNANLFSYLFGSITTVTVLDIRLLAILTACVLGTLWLGYRWFFVVSFDEELARAEGVRAWFWNTLLIVLAALVVSASLRIVGGLLIGALMVMPVLTAMQFARSFRATLAVAVIASVLATLLGLTISYYANLASGGTIVLLSLFGFLFSAFIGKRIV